MSTPLLTTKLYFPAARANLVARPRLVERLNAGLSGPLTLVSAPAGYGKTTLIGEWRAAEAGRAYPLAWISLDLDDNDPARFLAYLIAAIGMLEPGFGEITLGSLQSLQPPPPQAILASLINELNEIGRTFALVLDDYHVITNQLIHETLSFLLDHLPPHMHLVILSRADPALPLARLRARGQLVEIRAADLRFTSAETTAFLNQLMGLSLSEEEINALDRRTEGWPAGLQLAGLAIQALLPGQARLSRQERDEVHNFVTAFTGSHHYILDYLAGEVLNRLTESMGSFLLQTSILDRLSGPLCDALTGGKEGQATLEALEQENSFIISLDGERRWYRYHHLFADVLRSRLKRMAPEQLSDLHRRAAAWYEDQNFVAEAIHHALAAGDPTHAAQLVERNAMFMLMNGEMSTLLGWIRSIEIVAHERPWLCIYSAWALTLTGQLDPAKPWLLEAENLIQDRHRGIAERDMLGSIAAIRAFAAVQRGEAFEAISLAEQALEHLPESNQAVRSVVTMTLGTARRLSGDLPGASHALEEAVRAGQAAGNLYLAFGALSGLADLSFDQGRLRHSFERYSELLRLATRPDGRYLPAAGMAFFGLALICYEQNDLQMALRYIRQAIELCQHWGHIGILMGSYVMQFRIRQALGELDSAWEAMNEAERLARAYSQVPRATSWVEAFRVRYWLAHGDRDAAIRWAQQSGLKIEDDVPYLREAEYLVLGRVLLEQGEYDQALALLERLRQSAETAGRMGSLLELLVLQALILQSRGESQAGLEALRKALSLAASEGYVRVFLDEGPPLAKLLRQAGSRGIEPRYVSGLLAEFDRLPGSQTLPQQPLIEPLSERELEILQLIAAGKSNREIAAQLVLSTGTVKSHLSHIFGKLSVDSRTQCVARARDLKILQE